jgi:hypothetical protein
MQSQDEYNRIKQLTEVDFSKLDELAAKIKTAEEKGAVSHTIGKLPKAEDNVTINGLSYKVEFADFVKGKFTVKLICRDK